jgi:aspartate carbamoyltransferase catalytic subunit
MNNFPSIFESIKDLNLAQIEGLVKLSKKFKNRESVAPPFLNNRRPIIATSFLENSTRTKHSFAIAVERLGASYLDFNADTSSLKKGESLEETLLTLHCQGVELCIIRTSVSEQFKEFKDKPPIKIINGGDGINEHPTQALLDLLTLIEMTGLENFEGKTISIVGDLVHSRVGHSLLHLLPQFGFNIILCGPKECLPPAGDYPFAKLTENLDEAIKASDFLYLLRIQKERHQGAKASYYDNYPTTHGVSLERLKKLGKLIPVMHPGPANVGVEISLDLMRSPHYWGYEQVKNSIFMRMAIIQSILQNNDKNVGELANLNN